MLNVSPVWPATVDGTLRVAHLGSGTARLNDFADATTFDGVVRGMEIPGCQAATLTGSDVVAGRETYVVDVRPTPATCSGDSGNPATAKTAAFLDDLGSFTVWIDKETNVQLKSEKRDASGTVVSRYTTLTFETGAAVDRSVLAYTPPSGAPVVEVSDYTNAKHAIYEGTSEGRPAKGAP